MNKILVVETDPVLLELLAELLELNGYYPLTTTSFRQGYEITQLEKPHLILCGHSSKYIDSYKACWKFLQAIRQNSETANIPFIFMAGSDLSTISDWQNYLTYQQILLKPFNSQTFLGKIHNHLQYSQIQSHTNNSQTSPVNTGYIHQNAIVTKANQSTHEYSYFSA